MQFVSPILGVITVVAAFLIAVSPLADYGLQIAAFTMVVYVGVSFLIRKRILSADIKVTLDILVFSLTISLLIFTTGGFASPVFFLSYFLLFGVTLFSSPITATAITVTFALLFIVAPKADFWMDLLFGRQYIKVIADKKMITGLNQKVQKDKIDVTTWTEGDFRRRLLRIQEYLQKLGQDPSIELDKKERINSLYRQIYDLFLSGRSLEKKI
ncbi:MAG: hypothetical protein UW47_C0005G0033 [Candidatus Woesebacteria bacterium GW2011_GWA1_44_23]|uniref:Uncharacterized protein n=1 Tax=Candidatus Woesebacteria bacterium GW2011_GWA1_44_23 TaxID=1618558 RepID=A0A837IBR6_9BACT|nr:MAG: hypothetical protein UW47_C0005G0033 [Candidatus Woesebacteria bacterium GW2011_GWA1_44_23]